MNLDFLKGQTVLITGSTGMIGSQLVEKLIKYNQDNVDGKQIRIIALYRNEEKRRRIFFDELANTFVQFVKHDINEPIKISIPVDYIVHTAGVTGGSKQHVEYPMRTINTAVNGTINTLDLARHSSCKGYVFLSSLEVYGKFSKSALGITEDENGELDSMSVRSSYSESKRLCETICAAYASQYDVPAKVVRLAPTYGTGASVGDERVLCQFAMHVLNGTDIILKTPGDTVRNYCDVKDAVNAIYCVLKDGISGEAYNIANMRTTKSIKELADRFVKLYPEKRIKIIFELQDDIKTLGYNPTMTSILNTEKIEALGWSPRYGVDEMIRHLVNSLSASKTESK